ncbi:MAG: hypothetical protein GH151_09725 [Bacteroidetes bacterium]|nr:hypothetical protein [Bacteroidota bacterium]
MVGYGCIAASIIYNKKAVSSYNDYLNTNDLQEIETFYDNSVNEDNLSEVFAYAAIGIWVTDFIWTIAGSSKLNNQTPMTQRDPYGRVLDLLISRFYYSRRCHGHAFGRCLWQIIQDRWSCLWIAT